MAQGEVDAEVLQRKRARKASVREAPGRFRKVWARLMNAAKGVGAALIFRAVRNFAGDHGRAQGPLRPVVGRLDFRMVEKPQHVATIVLPADAIQQSLVVRVLKNANTQVD